MILEHLRIECPGCAKNHTCQGCAKYHICQGYIESQSYRAIPVKDLWSGKVIGYINEKDIVERDHEH